MDKLTKYDWPGNVRELENIIERGIILSTDSNFLIPELGIDHQDPIRIRSGLSMKEMERHHILWALKKTGWKIRGRAGAAEILQIHPSTLAFRMKKLGIQRP
jgi:formate hydrogenlyase transcriptional activator